MEFTKKLKTRLYVTIIYIALGIIMIASTFVTKTNNSFISSFGLALTVLGIVRIKKHFLITKNEETIRKQQITETDERNVSIMHKARSSAFSLYTLISGIIVIILSFFNIHNVAKYIAYSVLLLVSLYWICYIIYQKKS